MSLADIVERLRMFGEAPGSVELGPASPEVFGLLARWTLPRELDEYLHTCVPSRSLEIPGFTILSSAGLLWLASEEAGYSRHAIDLGFLPVTVEAGGQVQMVSIHDGGVYDLEAHVLSADGVRTPGGERPYSRQAIEDAASEWTGETLAEFLLDLETHTLERMAEQ